MSPASPALVGGFFTKVHLVKALVFPVVMCGCQSWTIKKAERRRIDAFVKVWERASQGGPGPHAEHPFGGWYLGLGREMGAQQQQYLLPRGPPSGKRDGSSLWFLLALVGFFPLTLQ